MISITPHPINTDNRPLKKSNLKHSNKFTEVNTHNQHQNLNEQSHEKGPHLKANETASHIQAEIKADEIEEYQIEDIEREILRTPSEQLSVQPSHYRNQIVSHEDSQSRKSGSRIATNGSLTLSKKNVPVRQSLPPLPPAPRDSIESKEAADTKTTNDYLDRDSIEMKDVSDAYLESESDIMEMHAEHSNTLRRGQNRYQRFPRSNQISRLPPVPERPSLENRELSPVPDIVSPTFLSAAIYDQSNPTSSSMSNQSDPTYDVSRSTPQQPQVISNGVTSRRTSFTSPQRQGHTSSRGGSPRKTFSNTLSDPKNAPSNNPADMHNLNTGTLGRRRSRIPTPRQNNAGPNKLNRYDISHCVSS